MVEHEHFNRERAVQYYAEQYMSFGTKWINNTLRGVNLVGGVWTPEAVTF